MHVQDVPVEVQQLLLPHGSQCRTISKVKNTNRTHSLGEEQNSKLDNSLQMIVIGIFFCIKACDPRARLHSAASGADDHEENSMDFCTTIM